MSENQLVAFVSQRVPTNIFIVPLPKLVLKIPKFLSIQFIAPGMPGQSLLAFTAKTTKEKMAK